MVTCFDVVRNPGTVPWVKHGKLFLVLLTLMCISCREAAGQLVGDVDSYQRMAWQLLPGAERAPTEGDALEPAAGNRAVRPCSAMSTQPTLAGAAMAPTRLDAPSEVDPVLQLHWPSDAVCSLGDDLALPETFVGRADWFRPDDNTALSATALSAPADGARARLLIAAGARAPYFDRRRPRNRCLPPLIPDLSSFPPMSDGGFIAPPGLLVRVEIAQNRKNFRLRRTRKEKLRLPISAPKWFSHSRRDPAGFLPTAGWRAG